MLSWMFLMILPLLRAENMTFWGISRTWPVPMPVHSQSRVLPIFYSTSCEMNTACTQPLNYDWAPYNASDFILNRSLCISWNSTKDCILLARITLTTWNNPLRNNLVPLNMLNEALSKITQGHTSGSGIGNSSENEMNITTLVLEHTGIVPLRNNASDKTSANRTVVAPYCEPVTSTPPVFTPCQGGTYAKYELSSGFQFSPDLKSYMGRKEKGNDTNETKGNDSTKWYFEGWPFYSWLLVNEAGVGMDISALATLQMP